MKIYRFMSKKEFNLISHGVEVLSRNNHFKSRTESKGFCFLGEKTEFFVFDEDANEYVDFVFSPEQCYSFLGGIVSDEFVVEFETIDSSDLTVSEGYYADPTYISGYDGTISIKEYCTEKYSIDTMKPLRYGFVDNEITGHITWYDWN